MAGRPTKFTEERAKTICDNLRMGCTRKAAVGAAGVGFDAFLRWMVHNTNFATDVMRAEDEAEKAMTRVMAQAAVPHEVVETTTTQTPDGTVTKTVVRREFDWRAAESWLKRRRRLDWGDSIDVRKLDDETLLRLLGLAEGSGTTGDLPSLSPFEP